LGKGGRKGVGVERRGSNKNERGSRIFRRIIHRSTVKVERTQGGKEG
jgi:hypothetical protein